MNNAWRWIGASGVLWMLSIAISVNAQETYRWNLPSGVPPPPVPIDNPMTADKVELGRHLFYDVRLSANATQSCASCHDQSRAFTDGRARGVGSTGEVHPRGSMSLVNIAYAPALTWANPGLTKLEEQTLVPMYGEHPIELGLDRSDRWLATIGGDARYQRLFAAAFPGTDNVTRGNVVKAIAAFERSIVSMRAPYDRYHFDRDEAAISAAAKRGEMLFHSRPLSCFTCHGGFNFSGVVTAARPTGGVEFHNTGLYNLAGLTSYPESNTGVFEISRDPKDVGKFKPPTLRNIAVTGPYMHDGSVPTLDAAIDHYSAGGTTTADGNYAGIGHDNPNKSPSIRGFTITPGQRADLIAFLQSLTDEALLKDPKLSDPWKQQR